jgi:hypothetical protein
MASSPSFVSNCCHLDRPLQTRFRFASACHWLKLATTINSLAHSPKGTLSGVPPLQPVVSTRFQSLFHSPRRGSFHLSLTVLFRYRSSSVFSLGRWTSQLPTPLACGVVLRILPIVLVCVYGTLTLYGRLSHTVPLRLTQLDGSPTTPVDTSTGLGFSAFARHYSQNTLFSSGYLDVSVHPVPFPFRMMEHDPHRVSPFGYPRLLTAAHA